MYLGIENRFTLEYFIGYPDPHCRIPFVTILPRPLAQWYARRKGTGGYRNYLYSSRGYRKLLERSGFSHVDIYAAIPSYNNPRYLIPLHGREFQHYHRCFEYSPNAGFARRVVKRILLKAHLLPYLTYSFAILARK